MSSENDVDYNVVWKKYQRLSLVFTGVDYNAKVTVTPVSIDTNTDSYPRTAMGRYFFWHLEHRHTSSSYFETPSA